MLLVAHLELNLFLFSIRIPFLIGKFLGFFAGCTAALLLALVLIERARNLRDEPGVRQYMETMFPLYRYGCRFYTCNFCTPDISIHAKKKSYPFNFLNNLRAACLDLLSYTCLYMLLTFTSGGDTESITHSYLVTRKEQSWVTEKFSSLAFVWQH